MHYPLDDLMSVLALESERHSCLVVGEDLGTVPAEMSHMMAERARVLLPRAAVREARRRPLRHPGEYPRRAIATVTTHDLPTLQGYWTASDIELRKRLALYPSDEVRSRSCTSGCAIARRCWLRWAWQGLRPAACDGCATRLTATTWPTPIHLYLARSAAALVVLQAEDLVGMADPVNVPGTSDEHANWQRKMSCRPRRGVRRPPVHRLLDAVEAARHAEVEPAPTPFPVFFNNTQ